MVEDIQADILLLYRGRRLLRVRRRLRTDSITEDTAWRRMDQAFVRWTAREAIAIRWNRLCPCFDEIYM